MLRRILSLLALAVALTSTGCVHHRHCWRHNHGDCCAPVCCPPACGAPACGPACGPAYGGPVYGGPGLEMMHAP
jgi:hypothetical protein